MSNELMQRTPNTLVAANDINQFRTSCQAFIEKLNNAPGQESIDQTPDGKASTILISHYTERLNQEMAKGNYKAVAFLKTQLFNFKRIA